MAILELKAARGWSLVHAARVFLVEAGTIAAWLTRRGQMAYPPLDFFRCRRE